MFGCSVFSNTALSWSTVGLTASRGPTEAAAAGRGVGAGIGGGARVGADTGAGAGGSSSRSNASVEPLKRATTSRRLSWKPDARSFFSKIRLVAACFSWRRQSNVSRMNLNQNTQVNKKGTWRAQTSNDGNSPVFYDICTCNHYICLDIFPKHLKLCQMSAP